MTGDEYLVAVEDATYDTFIKSVNDAHHKLDNISLGLVICRLCLGESGY